MEYRDVLCSVENVNRIQYMIQEIIYNETSIKVQYQKNLDHYILISLESKNTCISWGRSGMVESFNNYFVKTIVPHMITELKLRYRDIDRMSRRNNDIRRQDPRNFTLDDDKSNMESVDNYEFPIMEISDNVRGMNVKEFSY